MTEKTYTRRQLLAGGLAGAVAGAVAVTGIQSLFGQSSPTNSKTSAEHATLADLDKLENRVEAGEIYAIENEVIRYVTSAQPNSTGISDYVQETHRTRAKPITVTTLTIKDIRGSPRIEVGIVGSHDPENYLKISLRDRYGTTWDFVRNYVARVPADESSFKGSRVANIQHNFKDLPESGRFRRILMEYKSALADVRDFFANQTNRR